MSFWLILGRELFPKAGEPFDRFLTKQRQMNSRNGPHNVAGYVVVTVNENISKRNDLPSLRCRTKRFSINLLKLSNRFTNNSEEAFDSQPQRLIRKVFDK